LVRCNGYYIVIGISITRNKRSYNVIAITIHLFSDNMNRTLNLYSIFYYNIINIRVLLIIRVLIILKHFGDLDFKCYIKYIYIYICVCVCARVCVEREREILKKVVVNYGFWNFLKKFKLLRNLKNNYYDHFDKK
jgi:hypothetical protein